MKHITFAEYLQSKSDKEIDMMIREIVRDYNIHNDLNLVISDIGILIKLLRK